MATCESNVGRVMKQLDELGLTEKTIVIFSSDHGYSMGHNGIWHKGNGHWVLTENPKATYNIPDGHGGAATDAGGAADATAAAGRVTT